MYRVAVHGVTCGVLAILTIAGCKDPVKVSADPVTSPNVELTGPKKTLRLTVSPGPEAVSPTPVQVEAQTRTGPAEEPR